MIQRILEYIFKWKIKKTNQKIEKYNIYCVNLKNRREYIKQREIERFVKKYNKINQFIQLEKLINLNPELVKTGNQFLEQHKNFITYCESINHQIKDNEMKANAFLVSLIDIKRYPENDKLYQEVVNEYQDVGEYLNLETKKILTIFKKFKQYYLNLDTYRIKWTELKKHFNNIVFFNNDIVERNGEKYHFIHHVKTVYDETYQYFNNTSLRKECIWDIGTIKEFKKLYKGIDDYINLVNNYFFEKEFKEPIMNNPEITQEEDLFIVNKMNRFISEDKIPSSDIIKYFYYKISRTNDRYEKYVFNQLKNHYGNSIKILQNVYITTEHENMPYTQVDLIVFLKGEIYALELKNYSGTIYGSYHKDMWEQIIRKRFENKKTGKKYSRTFKHEFQNPFKQNAWHIKCLKKIYNYNYKNFILFSEKSELKVAAKNIYQFIELIEYLDKQPDKPYNYSLCDEIYYRILLHNRGNERKVEKDHIKAIKSKYGY